MSTNFIRLFTNKRIQVCIKRRSRTTPLKNRSETLFTLETLLCALCMSH